MYTQSSKTYGGADQTPSLAKASQKSSNVAKSDTGMSPTLPRPLARIPWYRAFRNSWKSAHGNDCAIVPPRQLGLVTPALCAITWPRSA